MTTNKQLRELAEKAKSGSWFESGDLRYEDARSGYMHGLHHDEDGFIAAASPDRVLALLDENEALRAECDALRAKTSLSLGVGDGAGNLFVHGDYDSIKRVQALIFENEKLRKDAERYRWLRRHATLDGDSDYSFPEVHAWEYKEEAEPNEQYGSLDAAIDAAMQETSHDNQ